MNDRFRPDAALRRIIPAPVCETTIVKSDSALFEDVEPIGHVGRRSIPKSHRAEGRNFVD